MGKGHIITPHWQLLPLGNFQITYIVHNEENKSSVHVEFKRVAMCDR